MNGRLTLLHVIVFAGLVLVGSASIATAVDVSPPEISWQMVGTDVVRFQLHFHNADPLEPTLGVSGSIHSQEFGAFLPNFGQIGVFVVPPMEPESFFDVFFEVPLSSLPPSPIGVGGGGGLRAALADPCPPPIWAGNVDVNWFGPGGAGQINIHYVNIGVCPGGLPGCLHVVTMCPGNTTWALVVNCPGWTVTLLNEDNTPAPAVLPPNWTGWICVSANANVPVGGQCCFSLNLICAGVTAKIDVCAFACECPVKVEQGTWGRIKTLYR
jgi:hypothetical protein